MADILLRNLDDNLKERLRQVAASHGRSMNAELLEIVRDALTRPRQADAAELGRLAADLRTLSAGRRQTPSEDLLHEAARAEARAGPPWRTGPSSPCTAA